MEIPEAITLPVLNQGEFPSLPEIPKGSTLTCSNTEWQKTETELVASCIVHACVLADSWQPVSGSELMELMKGHPLIISHMAQTVVDALWWLVEKGFVGVVKFENENHFVPSPAFANIVLGDTRHLRLVPLN